MQAGMIYYWLQQPRTARNYVYHLQALDVALTLSSPGPELIKCKTFTLAAFLQPKNLHQLCVIRD